MIVLKLSHLCGLLCILWLLNVTSASTSIECIPLKLCPMALKMVKTNPYAPETVEFLRFTHCGKSEQEPMVWCNIFHFCLTPDSRNGTCKSVRECEPYMDFIQEVDASNPLVKKYLREFRCSTEFDPDIRVCCPEEKTRSLAPGDLHERFFHDAIPDPELNECGQQNIDNKIVGGAATSLDEFPWMALLKYVTPGKIQFACSGSLINNRFILTAAHCVDSEIMQVRGLGKLFSVILGEYDTRNETDCVYLKYGKDCADPIQEFGIDAIIAHPDYDSSTMTNDIAIIRLDRKVRFSDYVQPICLPPKNMKLQGNETFTICGWGKTESEKRSSVKRKAKLKFVRKERCNQVSGRKLTDKQICAGEGKGTDSCYGDSGGPLMLDKKLRNGLSTFIMGLVSYGYGQICGAFPGVYTHVPPFVDWIYDNLR